MLLDAPCLTATNCPEPPAISRPKVTLPKARSFRAVTRCCEKVARASKMNENPVTGKKEKSRHEQYITNAIPARQAFYVLSPRKAFRTPSHSGVNLAVRENSLMAASISTASPTAVQTGNSAGSGGLARTAIASDTCRRPNQNVIIGSGSISSETANWTGITGFSLALR